MSFESPSELFSELHVTTNVKISIVYGDVGSALGFHRVVFTNPIIPG